MNPVRSIEPVPSAWAERALFFGHWLRHPLGIGALLPSARAVAQAMVRELPRQKNGVVLELGGGTGSITAALVESGWTAAQLVVLEREPALAAALGRRFPQLRIITADARTVGSLLDRLGIDWLAGVVSSLPIKWFGLEDQRAVVEPCLARLGTQGALLQLTNWLVSPLPTRPLGLEGVQAARVWTQFPPVQIWRYQRCRASEEAR